MPNDEMQNLWQAQPYDAVPIGLEQVRRKAGKMHDKIRSRNLREYLAGMLVVVWFGWAAWKSHEWTERGAFALMIAGVLYVLDHLRRHGSARRLPAQYGLTDARSFHLEELTRQRDLLKGVVRWYLGPMVPGWAALVINVARKGNLFAGALLAILMTAVCVFVAWINRRAEQRLDLQIAELKNWEERT